MRADDTTATGIVYFPDATATNDDTMTVTFTVVRDAKADPTREPIRREPAPAMPVFLLPRCRSSWSEPARWLARGPRIRAGHEGRAPPG